MSRPDLRVADDRIDSEVGAPLVAAQWRDLLDRYGVPAADQDRIDNPDVVVAEHLAPPDGIFLVAWLDDVAVACGGVRRHDATTGEVKRMYVIPDARRQGISRVVLTELEARARALGYTRLVLETGTRQPEAIALYESTGYESITPYGPRSDAPHARCYAKALT